MKVHSVMTSHVLTARPDATVRDLWKLLFVKHVNALPVVDKKGALLGIITKEDLLKGLYPDYQEYFLDAVGVADFETMEGKIKEMGSKQARDIMCARVIYTRTETPVMRALSRMIVRNLSQLPVLSQEDELVGVVTKGDIFYALFQKSLEKAKSTAKRLPVVRSKKPSKR